jgi:hypothetical protein
MRRAAGKMHPACPEFDEEQHVHCAKQGRFNCEEILGQDLLLLVARMGADGMRWRHRLARMVVEPMRSPNLSNSP